jgi:hypothetical protein
MPHMPSYIGSGSACDDGSCSGAPRIVEYTATGDELPSGFTVPVGTTMPSTDYRVSFYGVEDDVVVPAAWSFPWSGRTTTQFQARFAGDALTPGAVYLFELVED